MFLDELLPLDENLKTSVEIESKEFCNVNQTNKPIITSSNICDKELSRNLIAEDETRHKLKQTTNSNMEQKDFKGNETRIIDENSSAEEVEKFISYLEMDEVRKTNILTVNTETNKTNHNSNIPITTNETKPISESKLFSIVATNNTKRSKQPETDIDVKRRIFS